MEMEKIAKRPLIGINSHYAEDAHKWYKVPINYVNAVYNSGGLPVIIPCNPSEEELRAYVSQLDGIVFTGGADYPAELYGGEKPEHEDPMDDVRPKTDLMLMDMVLNESDIPILGICAGHQLLAISLGMKLIGHIPTAEYHGMNGDVDHPVKIKGGKYLKSIFNAEKIIVNSYHHQAVDKEGLPSDYTISAMAEDGVLEAIEYTGDRCILGVQWHPERTKSKEHTKMIFDFFIGQIKER